MKKRKARKKTKKEIEKKSCCLPHHLVGTEELQEGIITFEVLQGIKSRRRKGGLQTVDDISFGDGLNKEDPFGLLDLPPGVYGEKAMLRRFICINEGCEKEKWLCDFLEHINSFNSLGGEDKKFEVIDVELL